MEVLSIPMHYNTRMDHFSTLYINPLGHMTAVAVSVVQVYGIGSHQCHRHHDLHWEADGFHFIVIILNNIHYFMLLLG